MMLNRRNLIVGAALSATSALGQSSRPESTSEAGQRQLPAADSCLRPQAFGARGDGLTPDTAAIQAAMDAAHKAGGGTVYLSSGTYLTGTLLLRSHVSLWLDNGAVLLMSPSPADFSPDDSTHTPPGAYQTDETSSALLFGDKVTDVRLHGGGAIEGNRKRRGGPKPIFLRDCTDIVLADLTIRDAPDYAVSLYRCSRAHIRSVTILNGYADGIDLDCCRQVRVTACCVESVDDSFCLKATQPSSAHGVTEQIIVADCVLRTASIHFKCGTESCGDLRDIAVSNCTLEGGMGERHGNPGIALYTVDGGNLESVSITNIVMRNVATPFAIIRGDRDAWHLGRGPGRLRDISISHVIASGSRFPSVIAGIPGHAVEGIRFSDITLRIQPGGDQNANEKGADSAVSTPTDPFAVMERPRHYPEPTMFGRLPASALYLRHVKDVEFIEVRTLFEESVQAPMMVGDDIEHLLLEFVLRNEASSVWLHNVRDSLVDVTSLGRHLRSQFRFSGEKTSGIFCRMSGAVNTKSQVALGSDVVSGAVTIVE